MAVLLFPIGPIVKVIGLEPVGPATRVAVPMAAVKALSAPARPVGLPIEPTVTMVFALSHWLVVQGTLTTKRAAPVEIRHPAPLVTDTAPVAALKRKVVTPLLAEVTLPRFAVAIEAVWASALGVMQLEEITASEASIGCKMVEDRDISAL